MIKLVFRKPVRAFSAKYEGTFTDINYLTGWVKKQAPRQELYPEGEDGRLVLHGSDGTFDLYVGWWLVYDDERFQVLSPEEFNAKYEEKEQ